MPRKTFTTPIREAALSLTEMSGLRSLPPILTLTETARELRCSTAHVQNIIAGKVRGLPPLPFVKLGRRLIIRHDALTAWLLSLEADGTEAQHPRPSLLLSSKQML